ncbi:MAG: hypothetical protein MI864_28800 [Pseudomonadales bacterium]|nr:hypothetical protein [Pseudomonadales bacterium]
MKRSVTSRLKLTLICSLCAISVSVQSIEVQQGVVYPSGTRVESAQLGAAFTIPEGWQGAWPSGSEFFLLESRHLQANLFMMFDEVDQQQLLQIMSQSIPLDSGIQLIPNKQPITKNGIIAAPYTVKGSPTPLNAYVAGRELRQGLSVAIVALSQPQNRDDKNIEVNQITTELVKNIESRKPVIQNSGTTDQGPNAWQTYLRGRYIARYYTGSGYSEKQELWLCSDGSFYSSFNSGGYSMGGASGAAQSGGQGHWHAEGSINSAGTLVLQFGAGKISQGSTPGFDWQETSAGGERWTYELTLTDKLYLNNKKWLRGNNEYCQ